MATATQTSPPLFTAEDLERLPGEPRFELIRGELLPMADNSAEHGNVTARLSGPVIVFVEEHGLGECFAAETRFIIERHPDTTLGPDFAFVAKARLPDPLPASGYLQLAPDLVLETVSPNDTKREVSLKVSQWLQSGTRVVWVLDPRPRTLTVHAAGEMPRIFRPEETLTGGDILPGFELPMLRIFRERNS